MTEAGFVHKNTAYGVFFEALWARYKHLFPEELIPGPFYWVRGGIGSRDYTWSRKGKTNIHWSPLRDLNDIWV